MTDHDRSIQRQNAAHYLLHSKPTPEQRTDALFALGATKPPPPDDPPVCSVPGVDRLSSGGGLVEGIEAALDELGAMAGGDITIMRDSKKGRSTWFVHAGEVSHGFTFEEAATRAKELQD